MIVGFGLYFGVLPGPVAVRDHGHSGDLRARRDRARPRARARSARPAAPPGGLRAPRRAARAAGPAPRQRARGVLGGHARGGLPRAQARPARCSARSPTGASTSRCCGRAFTRSAIRPPWRVIVMAYFVGFLGNLLPLPGGIGGVDGGMIGALLAFGVDGGPDRPGGAVLPPVRLLAADDPGRDRLLPAAAHGRALARGAHRAGRAGGARRGLIGARRATPRVHYPL